MHTPSDTYAYTYDALGNLVASTHNGQTTQYLVDPQGDGSVLGEYDGSGKLIANYTYGNDLASRVDGSGTADYYDFDANGNTAGLSGQTAPTSTVTATCHSESDRLERIGPQSVPVRRPAGVMTAGNGLDFMRARFYSPSTGRFIQRDPTGLSGGANLYAYTANDPVNLVDPTGLFGTDFGGNNYRDASQGGIAYLNGAVQYGDRIVTGLRSQAADANEDSRLWSLLGQRRDRLRLQGRAGNRAHSKSATIHGGWAANQSKPERPSGS